MFSVGKQLVALASLPLATAANAVPSPIPAIENTPAIAAPAHAIPIIDAAPAAAPVPVLSDLPAPNALALAALGVAMLLDDGAVTWSKAPAAPRPAAVQATASAEMDDELECMAKVVHHEASSQSRAGQLAVAQLIMNRVRSGRFADTICGVANQPGQFFRTAAYKPRRDTAAWAAAVEVSRQARDGTADPVAPGALFFHAAYAGTPGFFQSRQRVTTLGGNVFYR